MIIIFYFQSLGKLLKKIWEKNFPAVKYVFPLSQSKKAPGVKLQTFNIHSDFFPGNVVVLPKYIGKKTHLVTKDYTYSCWFATLNSNTFKYTLQLSTSCPTKVTFAYVRNTCDQI